MLTVMTGMTVDFMPHATPEIILVPWPMGERERESDSQVSKTDRQLQTVTDRNVDRECKRNTTDDNSYRHLLSPTSH